MELFKEEVFYKDNGFPTEQLCYCDYVFYQDSISEEGRDYDQFVFVENALYPYIRLTKKRGKSHTPCGGSSVIPEDGYFARLSDAERNEQCPKIAWGFSAVFLVNLQYDEKQKDYVLLRELKTIIDSFYRDYLKSYMLGHNGLKYSDLTDEQKELTFLEQHSRIIRCLWEQSTPLKKYPVLFEYASWAEKRYEFFLNKREQTIKRTLMARNNNYSTEIRESFENKPYIKVFFLDDSVASEAKKAIEPLRCVKNVNITLSESSSHPGRTLTVYPKPMVEAEVCEKEVVETLNNFFANVTVGDLHPKNEAFFADIEQRILEALAKAEAQIDVCVAWFTNPKLKDMLLEKCAEGVEVRVIIFKDGVNHSKGVDLTGVNHKEFRGERGGILHDKFCVIDNVHTINGSYNWTLNAEHKNDEDAAFHYEDYRFASIYTKRFNQMWKRDSVGDLLTKNTK